MIASSIDIYLTYRCNLRCRHCFVGDRLKSGRNFDSELLHRLIDSCVTWQTQEVTFLGGEPTLYPGILAAIESVHERGMRARVVTNGLAGLRRLIYQLQGPIKPTVGFSIDGSRAEIHDAVRGRHAFARMMANIARCKSLGFPIFGVASISRPNVSDVLDVLELSRQLGLEYLNVHYVVAVGFADSDIVLPPEEWQIVCSRMREAAERLGIEVRVEELVQQKAVRSDPCAVRNNENLMFLPDGRVFSCPLFMDLPNAHSYVWTKEGLSPNKSDSSERAVCSRQESITCSAMPLIDPNLTGTLRDGGFRIGCVLKKASYGPRGQEVGRSSTTTLISDATDHFRIVKL